MALAGEKAVVRIRTAAGLGTSADDVDGVDTVALNRVREELETTDFKDTTGARTFILGLKGGEVPIEGDYESADVPQGRLVTAFGDGTSVFAVILWDGTAGHNVECKVSEFNLSTDVNGKVRFTSKLIATGDVSAV